MSRFVASLAALVIVAGCATPAPAGDSAAIAVARNASAEFCGRAAGCEFRMRRDGESAIVTALRFQLDAEGKRIRLENDSHIYVIDVDGRLVSSYPAAPQVR